MKIFLLNDKDTEKVVNFLKENNIPFTQDQPSKSDQILELAKTISESGIRKISHDLIFEKTIEYL